MGVLDQEIAPRGGIRKRLKNLWVSHFQIKPQRLTGEKKESTVRVGILAAPVGRRSGGGLNETRLANHRDLDRARVLQLLLDAVAQGLGELGGPFVVYMLR